MQWQRVRQAIEQLDYNFQEFDLESLVQRIEAQRQRRILRIPYRFQAGLTGLWVPALEVDYLFYAQDTHPLHQTHIILHELAHMVLNHRCQPLEQILAPELLVQLRGEAATEGRLRTAQTRLSDDEQEAESELFVYLIQEQVVRAQRLAELTSGPSSIAGFSRFTAGMGFTD